MTVEPATIEHEFDTIDFGHKSRNDRSKELLQALFANPQASINAACDEWCAAKGAYRFMDNPNVNSKEILGALSSGDDQTDQVPEGGLRGPRHD